MGETAAVFFGGMYGFPAGMMPVRAAPRASHAIIRGGPLAPNLRGVAEFTPRQGGTWVSVVVEGLPPYKPAAGDKDPVGPHGFHIHEKGDCTVGDPQKPFEAAGGHWNPDNQPHGNHASDLGVLFSMDGRAVMGFWTNRFTPEAVIGKAVMIHENPDDFRTQPTGDAGRRLGCGVIRAGRAR